MSKGAAQSEERRGRAEVHEAEVWSRRFKACYISWRVGIEFVIAVVRNLPGLGDVRNVRCVDEVEDEWMPDGNAPFCPRRIDHP